MTKKDYIAFADMIKPYYKAIGTDLSTSDCDDVVKMIIKDMIKVFEADNERFNSETFMEYLRK